MLARSPKYKCWKYIYCIAFSSPIRTSHQQQQQEIYSSNKIKMISINHLALGSGWCEATKCAAAHICPYLQQQKKSWSFEFLGRSKMNICTTLCSHSVIPMRLYHFVRCIYYLYPFCFVVYKMMLLCVVVYIYKKIRTNIYMKV